MIDQLNKRVEQIPTIRDYASQLLSLAKDIVSSRSGKYERNDFLGAMADAFMHKQIDHLKSICILVDADQNPDALIIARSSYENMALLLWSAHGPSRENRPRRWFLCEIKERYCEMIKGEYNDLEGLDPKIRETIVQYVQEYADMLLTKNAKRTLFQGKALSIDHDPFIIKKLPSFGNIIKDKSLDGKINQKAAQLYKLLSKWPHGDPQGMGFVFSHEGNCLLHNEIICKYLGGCAIVIGIQSLLNTAILFNNHFELDFQGRLAELKKQYSKL
jgi:hypothetical protein